MTRVAAIDCGTNTIKLLIADLDVSSGSEVELVRESRMVRLGQDVDRTGRLAEEALVRVFEAVEEYAALIGAHGVERTRFCATSAARDASNADVFVTGVEQRLDVTPEVVAGAVEAGLSFTGATRGLGEVVQPILVIDIGGGSTELVLGSGHGWVEAAHSLDMGSVRVTERFLHSDPPTAGEIAAAATFIDAQLDTLPGHGVDLASARTAVAVSGTGLTIAAAALDLAAFSSAGVDRAVVPAAGIRQAADTLMTLTVAERRALPYMNPGRADVIAAGGLIFERVLERVPVERVTTSVADILDGIAWSIA